MSNMPNPPNTAALPERIGRYVIQAELGRGAMGVVYRATDAMLNRDVAIKTILLDTDPEVRAEYEARFFTEAQAAGGLNHPNIITIHDIGREGDVAYMAMELLDGVELRTILTTERPPTDRALDFAHQIVTGMAYAHERGVIHRDLKPANIMVLGGKLVKIMDFGIARLQTSQVKTQTGVMLGSPKYMAPEQFTGMPLDQRADIFSMGVLLYELMVGFAPFSGEGMTQLMYQVCHQPHRPPSQVNPSLPLMLDLVVAKALAKDPADRYASAQEFAEDLVACQTELRNMALEDLASRSMRRAMNAMSGSDLEKTQPIAVEPDALALDETQRSTQRMNIARNEGAALFLPSAQFDSSAALALLRQGTTPPPAKRPGQMRRWIVFALAAIAAVVIALN